MPNTTNYNWATPADTDLVKDGASAIRTLGSSIDTTTKNLNPSTTLGDIEYRSSTANTNTRLAIGTSGQVLTVSAGVPSWATPASGGMTLINTGGTALSGASTTVSSIPTTYNHLHVIVRNYVPATDGDSLKMRFNADSTGARHQNLAYTQQLNIQFTDSYTSLTNAQDNSVDKALIYVMIPDYANTTTWKMAYHFGLVVNSSTTTNLNWTPGTSMYNQTSAITSLEFLNQTGNFTSGTVYVYGVK